MVCAVSALVYFFLTEKNHSKRKNSKKNIGHPTLGSGGKKTFKQYLKSEQTGGQTHRQTDGHFDL